MLAPDAVLSFSPLGKSCTLRRPSKPEFIHFTPASRIVDGEGREVSAMEVMRRPDRLLLGSVVEVFA